MTKEDKELLLKELCARLPYFENWVQYDGKDYVVTGYGHGRVSLLPSLVSSAAGPCPLVEEVRPYLRPMSSMTEEEKKEWTQLLNYTLNDENEMMVTVFVDDIPDYVDWLNSHHFDYRIDPLTGKTMIESGIALEAPEGMYTTK